MSDEYVTSQELLEVMQCVQDGVLKNSTASKNITLSIMALFKCLENTQHTEEFKVAMYDVIESLERNLEAGEKLAAQIKRISYKIQPSRQNK